MTFIWSPPDPPLQNGVILSYTLSCLAGADTTSVVTTQLQFTFNLFIPGETFRCAVYATNPFGDGPPTDDLIITTEGKTFHMHVKYTLKCSTYHRCSGWYPCIPTSSGVGPKQSFASGRR